MDLKDQIELYHDHGVLVDSRIIDVHYSDTELEHIETSARAMRNLHILESVSNEDITMYVNSTGGDEQVHHTLFDAIVASPCHVTTVGIGNVQSMGSIVLMAGDTVKMTEGAVMMLHYGSMEVPDAPIELIEANAAEFRRYCIWMENLYLNRIRKKHTKFPRSKLQKMLKTDCILPAEHALELGLIDEIERKRK